MFKRICKNIGTVVFAAFILGVSVASLIHGNMLMIVLVITTVLLLVALADDDNKKSERM
jgi:UDP-N-acetylmuramyl pentapeptide phosphotransferase/UDP-N-acetylglucosamine-1-phosphate transferase